MGLEHARSTSKLVATGVAAVAVMSLAAFRMNEPYEVSVTLGSAANLVKGGPVLVDGFDAGKIEKIDVRDGKAIVTFSLDDDDAPLHEGTSVAMSWKAVLSERQLIVTDGPAGNAEIPDGGMVPGKMAQPMEVDDLLGALDAPTRAKLTSLIGELQQTLGGHESEAQATVKTAGPALRELGQVLQAVGTDGPAIRDLVKRLNSMVTVVGERDQSLSTIVSSLSRLSERVATQRAGLRGTLQRLPRTLDQATSTLNRVPGAADAAVPLLNDLAPTTKKLGATAHNLRPVLQDLRPAAADLRPTLARLNELLGVTPGLLDSLADFLPDLDTTTTGLQQPVNFMRPYTPEITGMLTNWNSAFSNYDSNGHFTRLHIQAGASSFDHNPGIVPPGIVNDPYPKPGAVVDQPWTDANGSGLR